MAFFGIVVTVIIFFRTNFHIPGEVFGLPQKTVTFINPEFYHDNENQYFLQTDHTTYDSMPPYFPLPDIAQAIRSLSRKAGIKTILFFLFPNKTNPLNMNSVKFTISIKTDRNGVPSVTCKLWRGANIIKAMLKKKLDQPHAMCNLKTSIYILNIRKQ